jgi:hypothetical protein
VKPGGADASGYAFAPLLSTPNIERNATMTNFDQVKSNALHILRSNAMPYNPAWPESHRGRAIGEAISQARVQTGERVVRNDGGLTNDQLDAMTTQISAELAPAA